MSFLKSLFEVPFSTKDLDEPALALPDEQGGPPKAVFYSHKQFYGPLSLFQIPFDDQIKWTFSFPLSVREV